MKKPEDKEPKDLTEEDELSESEIDEVSGGVLNLDPTIRSIETTTPIIAGCSSKCAKGQGGTADWKAVG